MIGDRITAAQRLRGLTTAQLAERAGISESTLKRILSGSTADPGVQTLRMIAKALNVPFGWLAEEYGDASAPPSDAAAPLPSSAPNDSTSMLLREMISSIREVYEARVADLNRMLVSHQRSFKLLGCFVIALVIFLCLILAIDLANPSIGWFRYNEVWLK